MPDVFDYRALTGVMVVLLSGQLAGVDKCIFEIFLVYISISFSYNLIPTLVHCFNDIVH